MQKPDEYARGAEAVVKRGFTAMKFDPVPGPWRTFVPKEHIRHAVEVMRAVRDAVGPDVELLLDIHRRLAPMHAIDLANALAEFEPYWFEEPCQSENVEALAEVRRASRIPVVTGEALYARSGFRPIFRERAVDIINPDVSNCGGILELMFIAAAAEIGSDRGFAAQLQLDHDVAVRHRARRGLHAELHHHRILPAVRGDQRSGSARTCSSPSNGYIALPDGPRPRSDRQRAGRARRRRASRSRPEPSGRCRRKARSNHECGASSFVLRRARSACPGASYQAWAQTYPTRPVRMIVPFGPGGGTDIVARLIGQWLSERLGQQFVIENRPGAGGNLGTEAVVRAPPDG